MNDIELTSRQALICERALEMLTFQAGGQEALLKDLNQFSGESKGAGRFETELEQLKEALRG